MSDNGGADEDKLIKIIRQRELVVVYVGCGGEQRGGGVKGDAQGSGLGYGEVLCPEQAG